jgi:hypothetical protein
MALCWDLNFQSSSSPNTSADTNIRLRHARAADNDDTPTEFSEQTFRMTCMVDKTVAYVTERASFPSREYLKLDPGNVATSAATEEWIAIAFCLQQRLLNTRQTETHCLNSEILLAVIKYYTRVEQQEAARDAAEQLAEYRECYGWGMSEDVQERVLGWAQQVQHAVMKPWGLREPANTDELYPFALRYVINMVHHCFTDVAAQAVPRNVFTAEVGTTGLDNLQKQWAAPALSDIASFRANYSHTPNIKLAAPLPAAPIIPNRGAGQRMTWLARKRVLADAKHQELQALRQQLEQERDHALQLAAERKNSLNQLNRFGCAIAGTIKNTAEQQQFLRAMLKEHQVERASAEQRKWLLARLLGDASPAISQAGGIAARTLQEIKQLDAVLDKARCNPTTAEAYMEMLKEQQESLQHVAASVGLTQELLDSAEQFTEEELNDEPPAVEAGAAIETPEGGEEAASDGDPFEWQTENTPEQQAQPSSESWLARTAKPWTRALQTAYTTLQQLVAVVQPVLASEQQLEQLQAQLQVGHQGDQQQGEKGCVTPQVVRQQGSPQQETSPDLQGAAEGAVMMTPFTEAPRGNTTVRRRLPLDDLAEAQLGDSGTPQEGLAAAAGNTDDGRANTAVAQQGGIPAASAPQTSDYNSRALPRNWPKDWPVRRLCAGMLQALIDRAPKIDKYDSQKDTRDFENWASWVHVANGWGMRTGRCNAEGMPTWLVGAPAASQLVPMLLDRLSHKLCSKVRQMQESNMDKIALMSIKDLEKCVLGSQLDELRSRAKEQLKDLRWLAQEGYGGNASKFNRLVSLHRKPLTSVEKYKSLSQMARSCRTLFDWAHLHLFPSPDEELPEQIPALLQRYVPAHVPDEDCFNWQVVLEAAVERCA